jgi:hypothetical protein
MRQGWSTVPMSVQESDIQEDRQGRVAPPPQASPVALPPEAPQGYYTPFEMELS